jgi:hypothetical protein
VKIGGRLKSLGEERRKARNSGVERRKGEFSWRREEGHHRNSGVGGRRG